MSISRPAEPVAELVALWNEQLLPGATVTVEEGDSAVAVQNGRALGVFQPGEHALPAEVPADVRLYFVLTRPLHGLKFGGNLPALPPAPDGQPAPRTVFGDFALDAVKARALSMESHGVRLAGVGTLMTR